MNNKFSYVYVVLAFLCMNMHAAEEANHSMIAARAALSEAKKNLLEDLRVNRAIVPRSGKLDRADFERLNNLEKQKYLKRRILVARYAKAKNLVKQKQFVVDQIKRAQFNQLDLGREYSREEFGLDRELSPEEQENINAEMQLFQLIDNVDDLEGYLEHDREMAERGAFMRPLVEEVREEELREEAQEVPQQKAPAEQVGWGGAILGLPHNAWNAWWGR